MTKRDSKEYLYNFKSGGWNSEYATSKRGAIKQAKTRWNDKDGLDVDETSFRLNNNPEHYKALLSLFY
jgi:hypothetical protein